MSFGTVINCMDGRTQEQVNKYLREEFNVLYVDTITLAGPVKILAKNEQKSLVENVLFRTNISIDVHGSNVIAVCGHYDCAGIREPDENQIMYIKQSMKRLQELYPNVTVLGLWLDHEFKVHKIND